MPLTADKDALRTSRAALESALQDAGATIRGKDVRCPFHADARPSGSVYAGADGVWKFTCHTTACGFHGDVFDVEVRATGRSMADVLRRHGCLVGGAADGRSNLRVYADREALRAAACYQGRDEPPLTLEAEFVYTHPDTKAPELVVFRLVRPDGKKTFRQGRPEGDGWALKHPDGRLPIYNRSRLAKARIAVVVEGEKCVHALADVGLPASVAATTSPCGAGKAAAADWSPLRAAEVVYLWPDRDDAGRKHMADVADILSRWESPPDVRLVDPDDVGLMDAGDDVVDYLAAFGGATNTTRADAVEAALARARPVSASADLHQRIEDIIAGRYTSVEFPWPCLSRVTQALLPGTVTLLCGDPGAAKSFLVLQAAIHWHTSGLPVALFELEEDRAFWLARALAIVAGESRVTDAAWVRANADAARGAYRSCKAVLDGFARRLFCAGDRRVTHAELLTMLRQRAEAGCRVVVVDPVTALAATDKPWLDDLKFVMEAKAIAGKHGCSLVLVTHPRIRRGKGGPSLDEMAGGAAYPRFAQTVLWVERHAKGQVCSWFNAHRVPFSGRVNRTVAVHKARNAVGAGCDVAFDFDGATLTFQERGVVSEDAGQAIEE